MLKHVEEMARQAEERENPTIAEEPELEDIDEDEILSAEAEETKQIEDDAPEQIDALEEDETFVALAPRRMKFRIEEHA